jgi:hypothetical protein
MCASIEYEERFLDEYPRRRVGAQCDFGVGWQSADDPGGHRVTWLKGTGELYVLRPDDRIVVLGTLASFELAEAIINGRPEGEWRIEWLQAAVASAPTAAAEIAAVVAEHARRCAAEFQHQQQRRRDSFFVVELSELPDPRPPYRGNHYTRATWPTIAEGRGRDPRGRPRSTRHRRGRQTRRGTPEQR